MANITKGKTFTSGETVVPTKLHELVDNATVTYTSSGDTDNASLEVSGNKFQVKDAGVTTAKINDAAVTFAKQQSPQYTGFRNAIINGNFDIWQRGTSFSAPEFGSDRWYNLRGVSSCTMSRQAFTLGQTDVTGEPTYFCRMAVTSSAGAGSFAVLAQPIEDVRTFAGQSATISFYAKADASKTIALELRQDFGSGGSPSLPVDSIGTQKFTLTTSWQKFTATISIPSISGKTIGTNNNSKIDMNIWFDAGSSFNSRTDTLGQQSGTFDIAQVQVEAGSVATPFERRPIGTELALCQRYYETTYYWLNTTGAVHVENWKVTKRAGPTLSILSYALGSGGTIGAVGDGTEAFTATTYATADARMRVAGSAEL